MGNDMKLTYRQALIGDLSRIMEIYRAAQMFMEETGNPQWERGFPSENDVRWGIAGGIMFVVLDGNTVAGVFSAMVYDCDYNEINGGWLTDGKYLAVHRVAVATEYRRMGIAQYMFTTAIPEIAYSRGKQSIRMDTHIKNLPMRGLLEKMEFVPCGIIKLIRNGTERLAFEKLLK